MHTFKTDKITVNYNTDLSGDIRIRNPLTNQEVEVSGEELVKFFQYVKKFQQPTAEEKLSAIKEALIGLLGDTFEFAKPDDY